MPGRVESIHLVAEAGGTPVAAARAEALAGLGLQGDRKVVAAQARGADVPPGEQLTLIEAEAIEAAARDHGVTIPAGESRRNLVTRDVPLNHLVGRPFTVGAARVRGVELCDPCGYLQKTSGIDGITKALIHRGGLRCEVLEGGAIAVGDAVTWATTGGDA